MISGNETTPAPAISAIDEGTDVAATHAPRAPLGRETDPPAAAGTDVGEALRAVYRDAVSESVPDEMLDLLNKLD